MELQILAGRRMDKSQCARVKQLAMNVYPFDLCRLPPRSI